MLKTTGVESYFEQGRVSEAAVRTMFESASQLYRVAPWRKASDTQVLRMDIPALGVSGACLSIIGAGGESLGVIIFPSLEAFEQMLAASEHGVRSAGRVDLGGVVLSLEFDEALHLHPSMRREVLDHAWPLPAIDAYPRVRRRDREGFPLPVTEKDVRIASACALSLASFFIQHGDLFQREDYEPMCVSVADADDLEVRFTAPYTAWPLFELNEPPAMAGPVLRPSAKVGRNDPCPCGSGRKYKKCCLGQEQAAGAPAPAPPAAAARKAISLGELDRRLSARLLLYAKPRFGDEWDERVDELSRGNPDDQIAGHVLGYHTDWEGKTLCEWFVEERASSLSDRERKWLAAQQASWLSVLEVQATEPGKSITFRDLLTGRETRVAEKSASKALVRKDAILGRIVELGDEALLCGNHHRPLPPGAAAEVVARARKRLRLKRDLPPERLRNEKFCLFLLHAWEDAVGDFDELRSRPAAMRKAEPRAEAEEAEVAPEALALVAEFKRLHYATWPDHPLPALKGKTPRQAVKTKQGRAAVDALIKDMEHHEARHPQGVPFDFSELRRELGLD